MSATRRKPRTRQLIIETEDGPLVYDGLVTLLPRHRILLGTANYDQVPRFVRLFRRAWSRLPLVARRTLLRHWRAYRPNLPDPVVCSPSVLLLGTGFGQEGTVADCGLGGHELRFLAPVLDAMPDAVAGEVVVHELCHSYLHAVRDPAHLAIAEAGNSPAERAVEACLQRWGFGFAEDEVVEWLEDNGDVVDEAWSGRSLMSSLGLASEEEVAG